MSLFPKIQRPCPVTDTFSDYMEGDLCTLCDRTVHNIDVLSDQERQQFLASCTTEVCVKYTLPRKTSVAAVALSSVLLTLPSAAQDASPVHHDTACPVEAEAGDRCGELVLDDEEFIIVMGGMVNPSKVEYIDTEEDLALPTVPVTYED